MDAVILKLETMIARDLEQSLRSSMKLKTPVGIDDAIGHLSGWALVFAVSGKKAWFAYFLACRRDKRISELVALLPPRSVQRIAAKIENLHAHHSVVDSIQHVFVKASQGKARSSMTWPPFSSTYPC